MCNWYHGKTDWARRCSSERTSCHSPGDGSGKKKKTTNRKKPQKLSKIYLGPMHTAPSEIKGDDFLDAYCDENHKKNSRSEVYKTTSDLNSNTKFGTKKNFFEETGYGSKETGPDCTRKTSLLKDSAWFGSWNFQKIQNSISLDFGFRKISSGNSM